MGYNEIDFDNYLFEDFCQNDTEKLIKMDQPITLMSKHYLDPNKNQIDPNSGFFRQS